MEIIGGVSRHNFLDVAEEVLRRFLELKENRSQERTGGYLTVLDRRVIKKRYLINEIGECLPEMDSNCFLYTQEKSNRLHVKNVTDGHISAWQSRNREQNEFGGAIVAPSNSKGLLAGRNLIGALSGTYEHGEEAILIDIWMIFRWLTLADAKRIVDISDNQILWPLLNVSGDLF